MRALNEVQWPEGMWVCVGSGTGSRSADDRSTLKAFNEGSSTADPIRVRASFMGPVWILGVKIYPKVNVLHLTFTSN